MFNIIFTGGQLNCTCIISAVDTIQLNDDDLQRWAGTVMAKNPTQHHRWLPRDRFFQVWKQHLSHGQATISIKELSTKRNITAERKGKWTCIAPIVSTSTIKRSDVDHTELPANTPHLLTCKTTDNVLYVGRVRMKMSAPAFAINHKLGYFVSTQHLQCNDANKISLKPAF